MYPFRGGHAWGFGAGDIRTAGVETRDSADPQIPLTLHLGLLKETHLRCSARWDYSPVDMYGRGAANTPYSPQTYGLRNNMLWARFYQALQS